MIREMSLTEDEFAQEAVRSAQEQLHIPQNCSVQEFERAVDANLRKDASPPPESGHKVVTKNELVARLMSTPGTPYTCPASRTCNEKFNYLRRLMCRCMEKYASPSSRCYLKSALYRNSVLFGPYSAFAFVFDDDGTMGWTQSNAEVYYSNLFMLHAMVWDAVMDASSSSV